MGKIEAFRAERARLMDQLQEQDHLGIKRFLNLDTRAYEDGPGLDGKTKEFLGLVASVVLRCDDCINYHIDGLVTNHGATRAELLDALNVALVVGGSITIPHLRRAWDVVEEMLPGSA